MLLNLHALLPLSRSNGPGRRTVIWFQGCTLGCPGCFNPDTHSEDPRLTVEVSDLVSSLEARSGEMEGITISGGEPLVQSEGLLRLLLGLRSRTDLSLILFSGHRLDEIKKMPLGAPILSCLDVLIDGRYLKRKRLASGLRGSSNQAIHLLSNRYRLEEIEFTPPGEVQIDAQGRITLSGVGLPALFKS